MFLNGDVGQMDKHVVQFTDVGIVLDSTESTESQLIPSWTEMDLTLKSTRDLHIQIA